MRRISLNDPKSSSHSARKQRSTQIFTREFFFRCKILRAARDLRRKVLHLDSKLRPEFFIHENAFRFDLS